MLQSRENKSRDLYYMHLDLSRYFELTGLELSSVYCIQQLDKNVHCKKAFKD